MPNTTELIPVEKVEAVTREIQPLLAEVEALTVRTPAELQTCADIRKRALTWKKNWSSWCKYITDPIKESLKRVKVTEDKVLGYIQPVLDACDEKSKEYEAKEAQHIAIAKAKQEDEARKLADERKRKADELNAKELKVRQEADAKAAKLREAGKVAQADAVLQQGKAKAEELREKAAGVLATPIETKTIIPETTKVKGMHFRENWSANVIDLSLIPREYLTPDMVKLNGLARETKGKSNIPGVEFVSEKSAVSSERTLNDNA